MDPGQQQPAARTCQKHGIVLDPGGQCVICRRELGEPESPRSNLGGALQLALLLVAVAATGTVLYRFARGAPEPPPITVQMAPPPPVPEAEPDPGPELARLREEARSRDRAREDEERTARVNKRMHEIEVKIYLTQACELCRKAAAYLKAGGYAFVEVDVEKSAEDLAELRRLNPGISVPTLVVGDEVLVGYGPHLVVNALRRVAEKQVR
jgi:glutaredoxin